MTAGQRPILFKGWMSVFVNPKKTNPYKTVRSVGQPIGDYPCDDSFHSSVGSKLCIFMPKGQRK